MNEQYTYEELVERVIELENLLVSTQQEMNGYIKAKDVELNNVYHSSSWRITQPLRFGKRVLKKIRVKFLGR